MKRPQFNNPATLRNQIGLDVTIADYLFDHTTFSYSKPYFTLAYHDMIQAGIRDNGLLKPDQRLQQAENFSLISTGNLDAKL